MGQLFYPRRTRPIDIATLATQLMALKQRGDIAKGSQALSEKELSLRGEKLTMEKKTFGKLYGETRIEGRPTIPGHESLGSGLKKVKTVGIEELKFIKARLLSEWEEGMKKEPDMAALDGAIDRFGSEVPFFKEIQSNVAAGREAGKAWQRSDSYKLAKQKKVMGEFGVYAENLNKKAFGLEKKGDHAKAKSYRELAKEIVRPGFIDDFYQVPESLRTKATGSLEEFEAKEQIKARYKTSAKGKTAGERKLDGLKGSYERAIGQYYSATRGVGQFIADPNKEQVAEEAKKSAQVIARQYVAAGGNLQDLGVESADQVPPDKGISDEEISVILKENGYAVTPKSIKTFRENNKNAL